MDRYARHRLLAAIGDSGQERIAAASYVAPRDASPEAEIEREYLTRAGALHFSPSAAGGRPFPHAGAFHDRVAQQFAAGAWRALVQLKKALEQIK